MPSDQRALVRAARDRAASTGENYTAARAALLTAHTATATIDPALLVPYPDETDVDVGELGWRVLPADASAAQRACAEAHWRPVAVARQCRCSGSCLHGTRCGHDDDGEDRCPGVLVHVDRYPGGLFDTAVWEDVYECTDGCGLVMTAGVDLPAVPWGEARAGGGILIYEGVRHPTFPDTDENEGWPCPDCGSDYCLCDVDDSGGGCPECGAGSAGDPYGECVCEPQ
jgi:hypothetical protein